MIKHGLAAKERRYYGIERSINHRGQFSVPHIATVRWYRMGRDCSERAVLKRCFHLMLTKSSCGITSFRVAITVLQLKHKTKLYMDLLGPSLRRRDMGIHCTTIKVSARDDDLLERLDFSTRLVDTSKDREALSHD